MANATKKASATIAAPKSRAMSKSRKKPANRLMRVARLTGPASLETLSTEDESAFSFGAAPDAPSSLLWFGGSDGALTKFLTPGRWA